MKLLTIAQAPKPVSGTSIAVPPCRPRPKSIGTNRFGRFSSTAGSAILFFTAAIFLSVPARAQSGWDQPFPQLRFSQLTEKDGLSSDRASAVAQDEDGLIWISTANGLNRFDGYGCTRYFANPDDPRGLPANEIISICAGPHRDLWLETSAGICRYRLDTHKVDNFHSAAATPSIFSDYENCGIWFDARGSAFIAAPTGLFHFTDDRHYTVTPEGIAPFTRHARTFSNYRAIVSDRRGGLWAFQENMVFRLDTATKRVVRAYTLPAAVGIYDLLFDHANRCWISTWHAGILRFDPETGACYNVPIERPSGDSLPGPGSDIIGYGVEWIFNNRAFLAFASNSPGLLLIDEESGRSRLFLHQPGLRSFGRPLVDRQNILWVPTNKGVFYLNAAGNLWESMPLTIHRNGSPDSSDQSTPYVMREEPSGYWIGRRYRGGMLWYDRDWRLIRGWKQVVDSVDKPFRRDVGTTQEAFDFQQFGDDMFITTELGMVVLDLRNFRRTLIEVPGESPLIRLRTIVAADDRHWWVRSFDHGIFLFDPVTRRFTHHYILGGDCANCEFPHANYLLRTRRGQVLAATSAGLFGYDAGADRFINLHPESHPALGNSIFGMAEDSAGLVWIGADHGICVYDPAHNKVLRILSENNTVGIVPRVTVDSAQNVWFTSTGGYWCWLRRQDKMMLFGLGPGLTDNDEGLFYTTSNGNVYSGCLGSLIWFHVRRLLDHSSEGTARIMDIGAGDSALVPVRDAHGDRQVTIGPRDNNLQVNFDVVNYDIPTNNLFFYCLKVGGNNAGAPDWTPVDNGRLSFNHLAAGDYKLVVRGGNKLTGTYTRPDILLISVRPFWWQTGWFRGMVGIALLAVVFFIVRLRIRAIRRESAFREKIAETEMQALRAQMNPHFIFNSLTSIENFIMANERRLASDYLGKFARLIRMILNSSRDELVPVQKDMEALRLYVELEKLRFNNKFDYRTELDPQLLDGDYRVPSLLIQPYVENAIVHGIGGSARDSLYVCVKAFAEGDHIHFLIRDNGIGRVQAAELNRLNRPNHRSIGLDITADRIHIFSQQQRSTGSVTITDLYDDEGLAAGTQVEVIIKAV